MHKMSRHEMISCWLMLGDNLQSMELADRFCLDDDEAFYILSRIAGIGDYYTYAAIMHYITACQLSPDFIVYIWYMCGEDDEKFIEWVEDLFNNYAISINTWSYPYNHYTEGE